MLVYLRAYFQAIAAGDTARKRVALFLDFGSHARAFAEVVGAVDGDPGLHALETFEHELAIDGKIAHDGKFGHGLDAYGLFELIDQRGAGHAGLAVDEHGAGAADFFQAIRIVGDWSGLACRRG